MVAGDAARSLPAFGSVSQSASRSGVTGISTDLASTSFNGSDFTLRVSRARGNDIHLSTLDDIADGYELSGTPISGHNRAAGGYILDYKFTETTASFVGVSWLNSDPTDYLAGGYWIHWSGNILGSNFTVDDAGAFVDGPELSMANRPNIDALQESATYRGAAEGLYAADYGSDFSQYEDEIGVWRGDLRLTANFAARTIGGCVGCSAPMVVNGSNQDFRIQLGNVPLASNGTFRGSGVRLEHPTFPIASTGGNWGGALSNRMDTSGNPRLVAGTLGGEAESPGGSEIVFIGGFFGTK